MAPPRVVKRPIRQKTHELNLSARASTSLVDNTGAGRRLLRNIPPNEGPVASSSGESQNEAGIRADEEQLIGNRSPGASGQTKKNKRRWINSGGLLGMGNLITKGLILSSFCSSINFSHNMEVPVNPAKLWVADRPLRGAWRRFREEHGKALTGDLTDAS